MKIQFLLFSLLLCFLACKKKGVDDENTKQASCGLVNHVLIVGQNTETIIHDTAFSISNHTFYTEHATSTIGQGITIEFKGDTIPMSGTYAITTNYNEVLNANKVFVNYFNNGTSCTAQAGQVYVSGSGLNTTLEFCGVTCSNSSGDEFKVSFKSGIN